jgi:capsular exopolysaccharide synthesis family protein
MSQIFDALQRSEADRNGKDAASASRATELLRRAEETPNGNHIASEANHSWNSTVVADEPTIAVDKTREEKGSNAIEDDTFPVVLSDERIEGPMQCEIVSVTPSSESRLVALPDSESPASEAFHLLGVRLRHMRRLRPLKKVLVTSTIPQEGKSVVAANLACTLALRTQQKVLLLEGDVRRPTQSKIFGLSRLAGICEWLNGERTLIQSMYRLEGPGIWILPAGTVNGNSLNLLQSGRVAPMMEQLMNWFDWVVIDSPPILPLADTSVWTNMADGILLVTRQGITQKRQLKRGLEALGNQKVIGAVLNSAKNFVDPDYYYRPSNRLPNDDAQS